MKNGEGLLRERVIRLPIMSADGEVEYVKIADGHVELELLTASEAQELLGVPQYTWDRWCRKRLILGHVVDRTERLYDWHQLDTAATVDGPIREFLRNRNEPIEEVTRG
jgi:hypothetical protein